jgi:hypothetical protein
MHLRKLLTSLPLLAAALAAQAGTANCPSNTALPVQGAAVRGAAPVFPADNWWNLDIRAAPVDPNSAAFISFINNGGKRALKPSFGGEHSPGSDGIYGIPYAVVDASQLKTTIASFQFAGGSDGVGQAFYPIPEQAITQPHWIQNGPPGNVDMRATADRHMIIVDCTHNHLYELYNVWWDATRNAWVAGSGAFFDMNTNQRRPEGWTSADAAGLAMFPGLVRYDEVYNPAVTDIGHAFRVTLRTIGNYVWPASHKGEGVAGALPYGARLRLKASVNGADPALRSADPNVRKIFRAMQKYGLIVADVGQDMFVSGTFDTRWNNNLLNPAFALLSASDFEVVKLGWNPVGTAAALSSVSLNASTVAGGSSVTGTVLLSGAAPAGGAQILLTSSQAAARVPTSVTVSAGATRAAFTITTVPVAAATAASIGVSYAGTSKTVPLTVQPAPAQLSSVTLSTSQVAGGGTAVGTVALAAAAPAGGVVVGVSSSNPTLARVPASITVNAGATRAAFYVYTTVPASTQNVTLTSATSTGAISKVLSVTP